MGFNEARAQHNPELGLGSSGSFLCGARVRGPHYDEHNPPNDPKRQRALKGGGERRIGLRSGTKRAIISQNAVMHTHNKWLSEQVASMVGRWTTRVTTS